MTFPLGPSVFTSLDPSNNLEWQLRCFAAWKKGGRRVRSVNTVAERDLLLAQGLAEDDFICVQGRDVTVADDGAERPNVGAVLFALNAFVAGASAPAMVVRPDVLPVMRDGDILSRWLMDYNAVGLTPEACIVAESYRVTDNRPVRDRLAGVVFKGSALAGIVEGFREKEPTP